MLLMSAVLDAATDETRFTLEVRSPKSASQGNAACPVGAYFEGCEDDEKCSVLSSAWRTSEAAPHLNVNALKQCD